MPDERIGEILDGAFLAVAATPDPAINDRIGRIASRLGVFFNNAGGSPGNVQIPSVVRGEHYLLAISTGGKAPGVPRFLREFIEERCPQLDGMIALQKRLRERLRETEPSQERRQEILRSVLADRDMWEALRAGPQKAWAEAEVRYLHG
jgi:precorrin-2 dehydrogenase/sirohydrochlorin ferrochelatase